MCGCNFGWQSVMYHFQVTLTLTSVLVCVQNISIILFGMEIQNLVCECILEWWIVPFHFRVTVTLTSDLVSRIGIKSRGKTSIFFEVGIPNLVCGCILGWPSVTYHCWVTVTLISGLIFRITMFGAFFSILFELGIPNLVCGCILRSWQSVWYQFCDLDLIYRIILSGAYLIYYLREESQICCMDTSLDADVSHYIFRSL